MHESEKWKGSRSVVSDSQRPHGLQPTRLLRPWDFPGKSTGVWCHCLLWWMCLLSAKLLSIHTCMPPDTICIFSDQESKIQEPLSSVFYNLKSCKIAQSWTKGKDKSGTDGEQGTHDSFHYWPNLVFHNVPWLLEGRKKGGKERKGFWHQKDLGLTTNITYSWTDLK